MTRNVLATKSRNHTRAMVLAGLAGGIAEVAWVGLYSAATTLSATEVPVGIARAVGADALPAASLPVVGMLVHFGLAVVLALAFGAALKEAIVRGLPVRTIIPLSIAALMAVWAANFGVVLPLVAPEFVSLMPPAVTAVSKLMFGTAMGISIYRFVSRPLGMIAVARQRTA